MILVVFRTILLVQCPWTNLWKGRFINTNYYYYYYYYYYPYNKEANCTLSHAFPPFNLFQPILGMALTSGNPAVS